MAQDRSLDHLVPDSCPECTFMYLGLDEHPCNKCRYENGKMSQFREVKSYEIPSDIG